LLNPFLFPLWRFHLHLLFNFLESPIWISTISQSIFYVQILCVSIRTIRNVKVKMLVVLK